MTRDEHIKEKQDMLLVWLNGQGTGYASFGQPREIVAPLIKLGYIHKDTYKFTGGAAITQKGRDFINKLNTAK